MAQDTTQQDTNETTDNTTPPASDTTVTTEANYLPEGDVTELQIEDLRVGLGTPVQVTDTVTVHYTGWLAEDGTVFDSSVLRGSPISFPLSNVIAGWQEGMVGMQIGGKRRLVIPSDKGYGEVGSPPSIPANADLVFEIELLGIDGQ